MTKPTVFITGAAAGIGKATALEYARRGYLVGGFDVDVAGLEKLRTDIEAVGGSALLGVLNVADPAHWDRVLREFAVEAGRLDILINNAGVLSAGQFAEMSVATHKRMIDVNFAGAVYGARAAFPYLKETGGAQVVNLCSASAIYGQPELATYSATKFALRGLTEALNLEWRPHDIRVIAMWPLFVQTGMLNGVDTASTRSLGVHLTPEDVAKSIWDATHPKRSLLPTVHYRVGLPAKLFALAAQFSPPFVTRAINQVLSLA
ncbi:SDR family oxidoreductase [Skermania sp. ID1734]|uniref:SDR family oxidoreductase n=1 Tax=Skermania sp. ID1734 TaxID=2597516 RepID=UPI00117FB54C|nr:SDR family oxidoreductase [Skermania sp. ID1734]TSD94444.1 SDR family oxidoreductase [Skermania sp. ID1734]